ncbi:hypothetical protein [Yersinia enterocolitica]|uniref:hypothetical protein n=1 Tax=unclassified Yersinia (in: enterobacteria) TaxID=2653513 RepID=UPI0009F64F7A|nr:hypothetical protein A6J66_020710 [Yersinia enterocolitica]
MLDKSALLRVSALTASLMLVACNQNSGASTAAVGNIQSREQAVLPTTAIEQNIPSAVTVAAEIPAGCRIQSSGEWKASVYAQPPRLIVSGEVETSTGGYEVMLERGGAGLNPAIVMMELKVVPPPADAMVSQMITPHSVKTEVPDMSRDLTRVVINCGGGKLAEIAEISVLN